VNYCLPEATFVTTRSGDARLFEKNFAASPCLGGIPRDRIIVQEGFSSAALAYNDAIDRAQTDLIVFAHQDVYFPDRWLADLDRSLKILDAVDSDWGVLGGWGTNRVGPPAGYLYSVGLGVLGKPFKRPVAVDTLDEFILILRKSSGGSIRPFRIFIFMAWTSACLLARTKRIATLSLHFRFTTRAMGISPRNSITRIGTSGGNGESFCRFRPRASECPPGTRI
jgi:hypothetical protein